MSLSCHFSSSYGECWAANSLASASVPSPGGIRDCQAVCSQDSTKYCGGSTGQFAYYTTSSSATVLSAQAKVAGKLAAHLAHRVRVLN